jgi:hypothetical protein
MSSLIYKMGLWSTEKPIYPPSVVHKKFTEICTFFTFIHVGQFVLLITFLFEFLWNFSNWFEISMKFRVLDSHFEYFPNKFCFPLLALLANSKAKCGSKNQNLLYNKCFLEFNLASINGLEGSIFKKKSKSLYPNANAPQNTFPPL